MSIRRYTIARTAPLRAALLLVFVILSAVHPGLFASASATGLHSDMRMAMASDTGDHHSADAGHLTHLKSMDDKASSHHSSSADNTSCEVHCTPLQGVAADCLPVFPPFVGCVPQVTQVVLQPMEPTELKRPPRA